ncbi:L-rhamnose mutarotase [Formosa haliotis]|uniref:L-rhamnose mutarotase n=1 Tax=Formosa haliotis TaxID=1555194 RepID=UPI0008247436|nr:L-rhamnose mutarotase [Formosa haliotis]
MIRKAFKMKLYSEKIEEYKQRHNPIWGELKHVLKAHGVHNYSIFLDEDTYHTFGYVEIESEKHWNEIASTETCKNWWKYMASLMETNPDNSPVSTELIELFHLD